MTDEHESVEEVLAKLGVEPTGDAVEDLVAGMKASKALRESNSRWGGILVAAMRSAGLSWAQIFRRTGIKRGRALGWSRPPR